VSTTRTDRTDETDDRWQPTGRFEDRPRAADAPRTGRANGDLQFLNAFAQLRCGLLPIFWST